MGSEQLTKGDLSRMKTVFAVPQGVIGVKS
jgi:hypothetical protein